MEFLELLCESPGVETGGADALTFYSVRYISVFKDTGLAFRKPS